MTPRDRILQRRASFVASAIAGMALGCSSEQEPVASSPQPCLTAECDPQSQPTTGVAIQFSPTYLCVGRDYELEAYAVRCSRPTSRVSAQWTTSDASVATVDTSGRVRAVAAGRARISATFETWQTERTFDVIACSDAGSDASDAD